ncbi:Uncharacterised protein [uncultured archaeon]|nr:Uncharacterised protein [uncultured archaeon]
MKNSNNITGERYLRFFISLVTQVDCAILINIDSIVKFMRNARRAWEGPPPCGTLGGFRKRLTQRAPNHQGTLGYTTAGSGNV